jgi:hypothetical protein
MSVNPFAGKLASHYDRRNVGAISLPGPGWRSTSSRPVGPSARLRSCWRRLGAREQSTHRHCLANPAVSDCVVHRRPARVRSVAREGMWGGSPAADRGPIRCVKIGANKRGEEVGVELWSDGGRDSLHLPSARRSAAQDGPERAGTPRAGRSCRQGVCARHERRSGPGGDGQGPARIRWCDL